MGRFDFLQEIITGQQFQFLDELRPDVVVTTLLVATLCGICIYLTYRFFHRGVLYSENFNLLISMVCITTAFIIITIGTNIVLTLGMVGALSIVRFRAAVKDPLDVGFLFWGVAAGLTAGARLYLVAFIGTSFLALFYIIFHFIRLEKKAFLLIIRYQKKAEKSVMKELSNLRYKLKNRTTTEGHAEMTVEIKIIKNDTSFLADLEKLENVNSVVLVEYTGDYAV